MRSPILGLEFLVLLSLWGPVSAFAQEEPSPSRRFTAHDGLPHESITALSQASDGRLWVGTRAGLAIYDGRRFETVNLPDSLRRASVVDIASAADGSVWVALNEGGVVHVRNQRVVHGAPTLDIRSIRSLHIQRDTVVAATQRAIWRLPPGGAEFERYALSYDVKPLAMLEAHPGSGEGISGTEIGPEGALWILDGRYGPGRFRLNGTVDFVPLSTPPDRLWRSFKVLGDGRILLTRGNEVVAYDPTDGSRRILMRDLEGANYLVRGGTAVYVTVTGGFRRVALREDARPSSLELSSVLPGNQLTTLLEDRRGTIWIGTRNGLFHFHAPAVRHVRSAAGEPLRYVGRFMPGASQQLWVGTYGSGLVQLRPTRGQVEPDGHEKWGGLRSIDGPMHAITQGHWYRRSSQQSAEWRRVGFARGAVRGYVDASGIGFFWHDNGIFRHDLTTSESPRSLYRWSPETRGQYAITQSPNGHVLLRARGALLRFKTKGPGPVTRDTVAHLGDFADARGRHMTATDAGDVWIVAAQQGLIHVNTETDSSRSHLHLHGEPLRSVSVSGDTLALATSRSGLFLLDARTGAQRRHLTSNDGLLNTYAKDAILFEDSLYVSHPEGITILSRREAFRQPSPPAATITGLRINHQSHRVRNSSSLTASERTVEIDYAAPYLRNPQRVTYEYRHVPGDTTWHATDRMTQQFSVREPGRHRLEVRARLGPATGPPAHLEFTVAPFFYETWWFWILCAVGLGGLAVAGYRWRVAHLRRRQDTLERTVTKRTRELRAEKEKTEAQAQRLSELDEAKNRFFANLSHEFRTPLTLITEPLRSLLREPIDSVSPTVRDRLQPMLRNAERLERLIDQLLVLSKSTAGRLELQRRPVDLVALARTSCEVFAPMAERHEVELRVRSDIDTLPASVDPDKLDKILSNLLSNAIKFTEAGGTVWLTVTRAPDSKEEVRLVVKDTGEGIPEADLRRIFDRFEHVDGSTTRSEEGTGIGLALTRELVELHDGTIGVESELGQGSAFTVRLPLGDPPAGETGEIADAVSGDGAADRTTDGPSVPESASASEPDAAGQAPTLLVVDDNADVCSFLRRELGDSYEVETAATGIEALDRIRESAPDGVVSDVMMPEMDGFELCEAIKSDEDLRTIPVLLLTARAEAVDAVEGLEHGADDYVAKPFDVGELEQRIERLLEVRTTLRSEYEQIVHVEEADLEVPDDQAALVEAVLAVIHDSIDDPALTVDRLAEAAALSRRQLTRRLREATGESPAALIRRTRLERAAAQLEDTDTRRTADVAYAVGFRTVSHFSKAFKKHFGCPPSQYPDEA